MFRLLLQRKHIFSFSIALLIFSVAYYFLYLPNIFNVSITFSLAFMLASISINLLIIKKIAVLKDNYLAYFLYLLFMLFWGKELQNIHYSSAYLLLTIIFYLAFFFYEYRIFLWIGILFTLATVLHYAILPFILVCIYIAFQYSGKNYILFFRFLLGILITYFTIIQLLILFDSWELHTKYFSDFLLYIPCLPYKYYFLIPLALVILASFIDLTKHSHMQSIRKRLYNKLYFILLMITLFSCAFFNKNLDTLLYLCAFPSTIVLARYLQYIKRLWFGEVCIWILIISILGFNFYNFL